MAFTTTRRSNRIPNQKVKDTFDGNVIKKGKSVRLVTQRRFDALLCSFDQVSVPKTAILGETRLDGYDAPVYRLPAWNIWRTASVGRAYT